MWLALASSNSSCYLHPCSIAEQQQVWAVSNGGQQQDTLTDNITQHPGIADGVIDVVPAAFRLPVDPIGQAHL